MCLLRSMGSMSLMPLEEARLLSEALAPSHPLHLHRIPGCLIPKSRLVYLSRFFLWVWQHSVELVSKSFLFLLAFCRAASAKPLFQSLTLFCWVSCVLDGLWEFFMRPEMSTLWGLWLANISPMVSVPFCKIIFQNLQAFKCWWSPVYQFPLSIGSA